MNDKNLFLKIRNILPSMNPALKKIAEYVINNPKNVKHLRIKDLANACGVAEATVTRFVKTIGFDNYQQFKIKIAEITTKTPVSKEYVYDDVTKNDNINTIVKKIISINIKTLQDTEKIIQVQNIKKAIDMIKNAENIDIYGSGGSYIAALNARMRFYRIGKRCLVFNDPNQQAVSASLLSRKDLAIGISNSGRTKSTVNALKIAKESGAKTICISNYDNTPITEYADVKLFTSTQDSAFFQESMVSRIAQMVIIDILYAGIAVSSFEEAVKMIETSAKSLCTALLP